MPTLLAVEADLEVTLDGEPIEVETHGDVITINVAELSTLHKMFRLWRTQKPGLDLVRTFDGALKHGGLSLLFKVKGKTLAHLGSGEKPGLTGFLSRILGLDSIGKEPPSE